MRDNSAYWMGRYLPKHVRIHEHDHDIGKIYSNYTHRHDEMKLKKPRAEQKIRFDTYWTEERMQQLIRLYEARTHPRDVMVEMGITKNSYESKCRALINKGRMQYIHIDWRKYPKG